MSDRSPLLDAALDRVSALEFELPSRFVNHGPMACEALATLGYEDHLDDWADRFVEMLVDGVEPIAPAAGAGFDWEAALGDYRRLPEWMGRYERAIQDEGWEAVVALWVPRLMPALTAALFHGVIRTAHAVRAIDAMDTPARRRELARALGSWSSWYGPGADPDDGRVSEDLHRAVTATASDACGVFIADPNIFRLHGVTGAMAVELLVDHLAPADGAAAVAQLRADHASLTGGARRHPGPGNESGWDDAVVEAAAESLDAHQIKLVEACHRGFGATGEVAFAAAARTVTGVT
jgi:hypothetical protein